MSTSVDSFLPLLLIFLPAAFAVLIFALPDRMHGVSPFALAVGAAATLALALSALGRQLEFTRAWAGWGMDFSLKLTAQSGAMIIAASALTFLVMIWPKHQKTHPSDERLLSGSAMLALALANGAIQANNLVAMLFFWQAMWAPLFLMIRAGGENAWRASVRAVFTATAADFTMILGISLTGFAAESMMMDVMHVPLNALGTAGFLLMAVGAVAKLGAIPFHGWMYSAAENAPSTFMALIPGGLNLLMGANFLSRFPGMFGFGGDSGQILIVLIIGAGTVLLSGMMALTAGDHKTLAIALTVAQGGALILGTSSSAGGVFAYTAIFAAAASSSLFLAAGTLDDSKDHNKPLSAILFYFSALVAVTVAFAGEIYRIALQDGVLGLLLSVLSLIGAIFAGVGVVGFARHNAMNRSAILKDLPTTELDDALAWLETTHCDPYPTAARFFKGYGAISLKVNDAISWFYDVAIVWFVGALSGIVRRAHNGSPSRYVLWVIAGVVIVIAIFSLS